MNLWSQFLTESVSSRLTKVVRPLTFLPRLLRYAMISEIEQKPSRPGSSEELLRRTYFITPTFNSTGNFSVGATAFSGMITVTPG